MADNQQYPELANNISSESQPIEQGTQGMETTPTPFETSPRPVPSAIPATADEVIDQLRQGPLSTTLPPTDASHDELEEIKRLLFPGVDLSKATPQELVTHLLINHEMDVKQAHDWVEFLAHTNVSGEQ